MSVIISFMLVFSFQAMAAKEQLIFALDLIRHGDRTSIADLPYASYTWAEGRGQLTALGMLQEYQLGLKLNQRYMIDNQLLPMNYVANTIYIRSTDYDRTIMSAQSLLMGLYPLGTGPSLPDSTPALPSNYQPIPIHSVPVAQDSDFIMSMRSKEMADLLTKYVFTREDWKEKSSELEPQYTRWSQLTGIDIKSLYEILIIGDTLHTYVAHDIPLPNGLTKEEAAHIIEEGDWIHAVLFKPEQIGDFAGKAGLKKIIEYIQQAKEQKSKTKFVLVSAHDSTILGVMSALHTPLDKSPPYASDLNFSLYKSDAEDYFVKVTFNNIPVNIPGCNGNVCQLNQLVQRVK